MHGVADTAERLVYVGMGDAVAGLAGELLRCGSTRLLCICLLRVAFRRRCRRQCEACRLPPCRTASKSNEFQNHITVLSARV